SLRARQSLLLLAGLIPVRQGGTLLNSFHPETALFPFGGVNLHNYSSTYEDTPPHNCLISLPKEKTSRFRKENRYFQHPERKTFRMEIK
ncbi:MAG: hypothetical protein ACLFTF_09100, partial [Desulfonatronovibrio sp.]